MDAEIEESARRLEEEKRISQCGKECGGLEARSPGSGVWVYMAAVGSVLLPMAAYCFCLHSFMTGFPCEGSAGVHERSSCH
jgi:hypothetical protein